jgi:hypothetical protein
VSCAENVEGCIFQSIKGERSLEPPELIQKRFIMDEELFVVTTETTRDAHPSNSLLKESNPVVFNANQAMDEEPIAFMAEASKASKKIPKFPVPSKVIRLGCIAAEPLWVNIGMEQIRSPIHSAGD